MPQPTTIAPPDRRQRFRAFMKRFNPTGSARDAIKEGLICQPPGKPVFKKLAAGADLNPGSQQLIVGGIGSGKTTELILTEQELSSQPNVIALYIDVSAETDLSAVNSGALLACLGMDLWSAVEARLSPPESLSATRNAIKKAAHGYKMQVLVDDYGEPEPDDGEEYVSVHVRGKLKPPFPELAWDVTQLAALVAKLTGFAKEQGAEIVALFDGLDRLIKAEQFWSVAEQDLRAIKPLGISVIAAGPLSVMYAQGRQVKDYFDEVHYLPPAVADPKKSTFLLEVLQKRGADELMNVGEMEALSLASGGVLRDLISLARSAGENAYLEDADTIAPEHVKAAIKQLGNSYLLGLGTRQKKILRKLLNGGSFAPSDTESMELLITRRILEQSESRYEVHPALAVVLIAEDAGAPE